MHSISPPYIATYTDALRIFDLNHNLLRKVDCPPPTHIALDSQNDAPKVALVSKNTVFIYDTSRGPPVEIRRSEPISRVEWIKPIGMSSSGYSGSKQIVVFTALEAHLYSLDCTHIILTILKPIPRVLPRPNHTQWTIVAESVDYNRPRVIYTFLNVGLVSRLAFTTNGDRSAEVTWSPDGRWLGYFALLPFGYSLAVDSVLGHNLLEVEGMNETATEYVGCWKGMKEEEEEEKEEEKEEEHGEEQGERQHEKEEQDHQKQEQDHQKQEKEHQEQEKEVNLNTGNQLDTQLEVSRADTRDPNYYLIAGGEYINVISLRKMRVETTMKVHDSTPLVFSKGKYIFMRNNNLNKEPQNISLVGNIAVIQYKHSFAVVEVGEEVRVVREILDNPISTEIFQDKKGTAVLIVTLTHVAIFHVHSGECRVVFERSRIRAGYVVSTNGMKGSFDVVIIGDGFWERTNLIEEVPKRIEWDVSLEVTDTFQGKKRGRRV